MVSFLTLFEKALEARKLAYAPYSEFKVGAAILTSKGNVYLGANVENVSYPCGTCAEAGAIAAMVCGGEYQISDIVVVANGKNLITPCGACLQRIFEFFAGIFQYSKKPEAIERNNFFIFLLKRKMHTRIFISARISICVQRGRNV